MTVREYGGYVSPEYLEASAQVLSDLKRSSLEALSFGAGDRVLDVGSGSGVDTLSLAGMVGGGLIVGVDSDESMVVAANQQRPSGNPGVVLVHLPADGAALPFCDGSFDGVRCERLLQHVRDVDAVVNEMLRVLRPGGSVVLLDTDWATLSIDASDVDLERRLVRYKAERLTRNGTAGRQLFRLLRAAGLDDVNVVPFPLTASFELFRVVSMWDDLITSAVQDGVVTDAEATMLERELVERDSCGQSFGSLNLNLAVGHKQGVVDRAEGDPS